MALVPLRCSLCNKASFSFFQRNDDDEDGRCRCCCFVMVNAKTERIRQASQPDRADRRTDVVALRDVPAASVQQYVGSLVSSLIGLWGSFLFPFSFGFEEPGVVVGDFRLWSLVGPFDWVGPKTKAVTTATTTTIPTTMSKPFDYSKWDNIELSDDEDDVHPNIDKDSWFRMKHRSRVEREENEEKDKKKIRGEVCLSVGIGSACENRTGARPIGNFAALLHLLFFIVAHSVSGPSILHSFIRLSVHGLVL